MSLLKKAIIKFAGKRKQITDIDFSLLHSVLVKPIGDAIGDSIAHTAHLQQLKSANPKLKIGVFVSERSRLIYELSGLVDVFLEDKPKTYFKERGRWDLYLDFMPSYTSRSLLLDKILAPKFIFVFYKREKKFYGIHSVNNYNYFASIQKGVHITDYLNVSILNKYLDTDKSHYVLEPIAITDKVKALWDKNKIRILIAPEGSTKHIPPEELAQFLSNIPRAILDSCDLILSTSTYTKAYLEAFKNKMIEVQLLPKMSLKEYIGVVECADIIIAVDSATVHIACNYLKPQICFYANNDYSLPLWLPKYAGTIPHKVMVAREKGDNNHTQNFDMQEAASWLIEQIKKSSK